MSDPVTSPASDWNPAAGKTSDELLAMAQAAITGFDPEDGKPITSPGWRLVCAVEALNDLLAAGGPLPRAWQNGHRQ